MSIFGVKGRKMLRMSAAHGRCGARMKARDEKGHIMLRFGVKGRIISKFSM